MLFRSLLGVHSRHVADSLPGRFEVRILIRVKKGLRRDLEDCAQFQQGHYVRADFPGFVVGVGGPVYTEHGGYIALGKTAEHANRAQHPLQVVLIRRFLC